MGVRRGWNGLFATGQSSTLASDEDNEWCVLASSTIRGGMKTCYADGGDLIRRSARHGMNEIRVQLYYSYK